VAERTDLSVDWNASPRIIWVNWTTPETRELTLQDLVDTAKGVLEYSFEALDDPILLRSEGKAPLEGGQSVAITITLENAVIAFKPNTTATASGTATAASSGTLLTDETADFITAGVLPGANCRNKSDGSISTVLRVVSATQLQTTQLSNGSSNQWEVGDNYGVINAVECSITGGNLVAEDADGDKIPCFLATNNIFVSRTSSASATVQDMDAIRYSSYGGGVSLDQNNITGNAISGTAYPAGTKETPSDNVEDTIAIAAARGFDTIFIIGPCVLNDGQAWDVEDLIFIGKHPRVSALDIKAPALSRNCIFRSLTVLGVLDGNNTLENCVVGDLEYIEGDLDNCQLVGKIVLGGTMGAILRNCYSGYLDANFIAEIDMGGAGRNLAVHSFSGHLRLSNLTGVNTAALSFARGRAIIDSTIEAGFVHLAGNCRVDDGHTGTAVVSTEYVLSAVEIDAHLIEAHGAGSWAGSTPAAVAAQVDQQLSGTHGAGSWAVAAVLAETANLKASATNIKADTAELLVRLSLARAIALDNLGPIGLDASLIKKTMINDMRLEDGSTNNWILYDDDGDTPLLTWSVSDKLGAPIVQPAGAPSRRHLEQ
jgi:hypothetical protein